MSKETVELLVEGGKATSNAQMGQRLGPLGINIKNLLEDINKKTAGFKGIKVPVKVIIDTNTKSTEIYVGTPPTSELIKKELNLEKGSGRPDIDKVGNLAIEQVIKITKMKYDTMLLNDLKGGVKSVIGSCNSMGILVEGLDAVAINQEIDNGKFDDVIKSEKTDVSEEKKLEMQSKLESVRLELQKELEKAKIEAEKIKPTEVKAEVKVGEEVKAEEKVEEKVDVKGKVKEKGKEKVREKKK